MGHTAEMLTLIGCFATLITTPSSTPTDGTYSCESVQLQDARFQSHVLTVMVRAGYAGTAATHASATRERGTNRATVSTTITPATAPRLLTCASHLYYPSVNGTISDRQITRSTRHHQPVPLLESRDSTSHYRRRDRTNQRDHLPVYQRSHNQHLPKNYPTRHHRQTCYRYPANSSLLAKGHHQPHRDRHEQYRVAICRASMRMVLRPPQTPVLPHTRRSLPAQLRTTPEAHDNTA